MNATEDLRDKCRTCRFLALSEGNTSSGYCWQCDKPVGFYALDDFPKEHDPMCQEVISDGGESAWEPLMILRPYFDRRLRGDAE